MAAMQTKYDQLPFLPKTVLQVVKPGITVVHPLSRLGVGPGIVVLVPETGVPNGSSLRIEDGVPSPAMKWAEEGYTVAEITEAALTTSPDSLRLALSGLEKLDCTVPKGVVGLVVYSPAIWNLVASRISQYASIVAASIYTEVEAELATATVPCVQHVAGTLPGIPTRTKEFTQFNYPDKASHAFATPFQKQFNYAAESVSHTRNLSFFKPIMGGPYFDLEAIWDEHVYYEFENRSVECTMNTMVQEPYVNHIPTLTGGIGREKLTSFYRDHFIFQNSDDTETELISRSVGIDRVIDEFIFKCTHDSPLDWLIPGIPPTHRKLEIPFTAVVNIRGDRLYHEHIAWDQATVLIQLGLLPVYLPFPHGLPKGSTAEIRNGDRGQGRLEYRVPAAGLDAAKKLRDKDCVGSNGMFEYKLRSAE